MLLPRLALLVFAVAVGTALALALVAWVRPTPTTPAIPWDALGASLLGGGTVTADTVVADALSAPRISIPTNLAPATASTRFTGATATSAPAMSVTAAVARVANLETVTFASTTLDLAATSLHVVGGGTLLDDTWYPPAHATADAPIGTPMQVPAAARYVIAHTVQATLPSGVSSEPVVACTLTGDGVSAPWLATLPATLSNFVQVGIQFGGTVDLVPNTPYLVTCAAGAGIGGSVRLTQISH
jgi:hypothetical protein